MQIQEGRGVEARDVTCEGQMCRRWRTMQTVIFRINSIKVRVGACQTRLPKRPLRLWRSREKQSGVVVFADKAWRSE